MRFEIVAPPHPSKIEAVVLSASQSAARPIGGSERRTSAREALDVFVGGADVSARVRETHRAFVLRDLAIALGELARRSHGKATVRRYDEPWEMCVERFDATACVSVYRAGPDPQVAIYDRAVPFSDVSSAARDAILDALARGDARSPALIELASVAEQLPGVDSAASDDGDRGIPDPVKVVIEADRDAPLSFGAEFAMRATPPDADEPNVERADLHALLFRGRVRAEVRGRPIDLGESHPLLVAERLLELSRRAFDAWERGVPLNARGEAAGVLLGVRVTTDGELALTLGAAHPGPENTELRSRTPGSAAGDPRAVHTFPALGVTEMLEAALAFGRSLVRAILRRDRAQSNNLRLGPFRRALREGTEALREASQTDSKVNPSPELYRAFAAAVDDARLASPAAVPATRLRYALRWRAIVPGIDLRATYLCGDRLVVGASTEMWALDRTTGHVRWRTDVARGTSVITPGGVARLAPDGNLSVYDLGTGEVTLRARIVPRVGGPVAGAVVHLPGLPKLVIVTEGQNHLVAIDLTSGEPRWRWSWGARRTGTQRAPRMKRAGRLVYFACGDGTLTALDVMTGAVVWRLRDRLRFRTPPTVANDAVFVVAGGAHDVARLYSLDAYSGHVRWSTAVADASAPCTIEGGPMAAGGTVTVALRHKNGLVLAAFRRDDGAPIATRARVVAPSGTSWLAVDDAFIGNTPTGELVAVDAATGELRWRQTLGPRPVDSDVPRRLEPVLRSGALFVPHADVVVVRPRDGVVLGTISPTEAIPDLLRVDERCDVYVAEESGHLLAFGALPRLSLVPTAR